jgi:hypothetical protein
VDLIKIDIEGHEAVVLETLARLLAERRPRAVIFEHEGDLQEPQGATRRVFNPRSCTLHGLRKRLTSWRLMSLDELRSRGLRAHDYVAIAPQGQA